MILNADKEILNQHKDMVIKYNGGNIWMGLSFVVYLYR